MLSINKKVLAFLRKNKEPCTQREISEALPAMNRAVLLGYLRCLVDTGKVKSKVSGKAIIYYI